MEVTNGLFIFYHESQRIKGKHLSFEERVIIQTRIKDGLLHVNLVVPRPPSAIKSEAVHGQSVYQANRYHFGRKSGFLKKSDFIEYVDKH